MCCALLSHGVVEILTWLNCQPLKIFDLIVSDSILLVRKSAPQMKFIIFGVKSASSLTKFFGTDEKGKIIVEIVSKKKKDTI